MEVAPLILVVEDSEDSRHLYSAVLTDQGYRVTVAVDGIEAIEKAVAERPQLVILDVELPRLDGVDVASQLRLRRQTRDVPIIFLTGHRLVSGSVAALGLILQKPCHPDDLLAAVERKLQRK